MGSNELSSKFNNNPLVKKEEPKPIDKNPLKTQMLLEDSSDGIIKEFFQKSAPPQNKEKS